LLFPALSRKEYAQFNEEGSRIEMCTHLNDGNDDPNDESLTSRFNFAVNSFRFTPDCRECDPPFKRLCNTQSINQNAPVN
jgi:hypothetical protein